MTISPKICTVDGCDTKTLCRGYCNRHYLQIQRHGKILEKTIYEKRQAVIDGDTCKIPLGFSDRFTLVDVKYKYLDKYKWSVANTGYAQANVDGKTTLLHKIILTNNGIVDHINRNKLDNRSSNLRICTPSQSAANTSNVANKSGYRGVYYQTQNKKWCVSVAGVYGGSFKSAVKAAKEYDRLALERWAEYAVLNF